MVRLRVMAQEIKQFTDKFQFQNGTIKRISSLSFAYCSSNFNSKMVRLRGDEFRLSERTEQYFNSKMVRLREPNRCGDNF